MSRNRTPIDDLRLVIDCLPVHTREAMLEGVRTNRIIAGAYTDGDGGVCPMLAAHRSGGRTNFVSFARAWDRFTHAKRMRRATRREVRILCEQLEASLALEVGYEDLTAAISDHQAAARRRRADEAREHGTWDFLRTRRDDRAAERALARVNDARELVEV